MNRWWFGAADAAPRLPPVRSTRERCGCSFRQGHERPRTSPAGDLRKGCRWWPDAWFVDRIHQYSLEWRIPSLKHEIHLATKVPVTPSRSSIDQMWSLAMFLANCGLLYAAVVVPKLWPSRVTTISIGLCGRGQTFHHH